MANIRTLKLNLLADVTGFEKGIKKASGSSQSFAKNIGRQFALAGAAIGTAAVAIGVQAVKAAAEDQAAQVQLAKALKNTTKASKAQVKQTEKWISRTQLAYGVSDNKLRPALSKLVRVTGSITKSQKLLSLALDVSAGSGVDLETATNAIAKAQQGQFKGLKSLGVPLTDSIVKNKDLAAALKMTEDRFKGAAKAGAETLNGKLARFNEAIGEAKESIGTALIEGFTPLAEKYLPKISDGITAFVSGLTGQGGKQGLNDAIKTGSDGLYIMGENFKKFVKKLADNKETLGKIAAIMAGIFIGAKTGSMVAAMVTSVTKLIGIMKALSAASATAAAAEAAATGGSSLVVALPAILAIASAFGIALSLSDFGGAKTTSKSPTQDFYNKNFGPNAASAKSPASASEGLPKGWIWYNGVKRIDTPMLHTDTWRQSLVGLKTAKPGTRPGTWLKLSGPKNFKGSSMGGGSAPTVINLNGIVDAESARRNIERLLQKSSIRSGPINLQGAAI